MAAAKKASFASKQIKGGPAPLASFEDLPSDEMDSPNSSFNDPDQDSLSCSNVEDLNLDSTPGTITCSPISALHIDVVPDYDNESQHTLTPCNAVDDCDTQQVIPVFIMEPDPESQAQDGADGKQQFNVKVETPKSPDSQNTMANPDELQVNLSKNGRKGSWTDIFRSRSHSGSRSPQPSPQSPRKALPEVTVDEAKTGEGKKCKKKSGGIFNVFHFHGKKSDKHPKSPVNPSPPVQATLGDATATSSGINLPSQKQLAKTNIQVTVQAEKGEKVPENNVVNEYNQVEIDFETNDKDSKESNKENYEQTVANEENVFDDFSHPGLKAKLSLERKSKSLDHEPMVREGKEEFKGSSESELATEEKKEEEEEVDFEAETLLNQDSIEYDESLSSEMSTLEVFKVEVKSQPRRQRLEITTVPIERPRSTTPISVAPFEAFIQSAQQTQLGDQNVEKLKVLLPGEQFCGRLKSPKKTPKNLASWQDFCQSGLHSPRITKRPSNEAFDSELSPPVSAFSSEVSPFGTDEIVSDNNITHKWETFEFTKKVSSNNASDAIVNADQSSSKNSDLPPSQGYSFKKENLKLSFSSSLSSDSNSISQDNDAFDIQINSKDW